MDDDPIVAEVRRAREQIAAECGYDWARLLQREQEIYERWKDRMPLYRGRDEPVSAPSRPE